MKKSTKKLALSGETIRSLDKVALAPIHGGIPTTINWCQPPTRTWDCSKLCY